MSDGVKFPTRTILLVGQMQRDTVGQLAQNVPAGVEVVFREPVKGRTPDANARMWAGPLKDISSQAWVQGRQYSDVAWHEIFKVEYLPDESVLSVEELARRVKNPETYRKWDIGPKGNRILVGSTTELTKFGFSEYLEQVTAYGAADLGVQFTASPNEGRP